MDREQAFFLGRECKAAALHRSTVEIHMTHENDLLREIGDQLDRNIFPSIKDAGIVVPSNPSSSSTLGKEKWNGNKRRSATGSWEGTAGGQGTTGGSRPAGEATSFVCERVPSRYEDELGAVHRAYPGARVWSRDDGLWLLARSSLLPGLPQAAIFLVGISHHNRAVRAWGFWQHSTLDMTWIGPRHTNFPDGSICAFEPSDGTWLFGDSLVELIDLYTLWALRHLHLGVFDRWPGPQAVHFPYERILEFRDDELCGCANTTRRYGQCCKSKDLVRNRITDAVNFTMATAGGLRQPPASIVAFMHQQRDPPPIEEMVGRFVPS